MGYETRLRAAEDRRPAPVKHCPTKPHPYGFLTHQMVSKSAKTKLPYLYTYIPWLDAKVPLKEHESLRQMVLEWDRPYAFHFVGDSKFGTEEFFNWRKGFKYYGTFAIPRNTSSWLWNVMELDMKSDCWRGMMNDKIGLLACVEQLDTQSGPWRSHLFTNAFTVGDVIDLNPDFEESKYSESELAGEVVEELKKILRSRGLRVSGSKRELIQRILSHCKDTEENVLKEYLDEISKTGFTGKSATSQLYLILFNGTDLFDKLQKHTIFHYRAVAWEEQFTLGILEFSIINAFVLYCDEFPTKSDNQSDNFVIFREAVAHELMNTKYETKGHKRKQEL
jgi:hypothetical protein